MTNKTSLFGNENFNDTFLIRLSDLNELDEVISKLQNIRLEISENL